MPPRPIYRGVRDEDGVCHVAKLVGADEWKPLDLRLDLRAHSPTGFEWNYAGSGPAQLSLALLADYLRDDRKALEIYQDFKFAVVGRLPKERWDLTKDQIEAGIKKALMKK